MRVLTSAVLILVLGIFSCQDPNAPTSDFTVTVTGTAVNKKGATQDSVIVVLDNPFRRDTTKSDGTFSYTFTSSEKNEVTATFKFTHRNLAFRETTLTRTYSSSKKTIAFGEVTLNGVDSSADNQDPTRPSSRAGVVTFVSSTFKTISIRGAGGNEVTNLTFEVRDSLGTPVDDKNKISVSFKLITKPDIAVELNRTNATTNSIGQVVVQLTSGDKAGIAQVQAVTAVKNLVDTTKFDTLKSQIISVAIAGGLPAISHFTLGSEKLNVPGLVRFGMKNTITAIVADTFGNPVQKGTIVSFTTNGGIIKNSAETSEDGLVSVDLITSYPYPPNGFATVTAQVGTPGILATKSNDGDAANSASMDEAVVIKGLRNKKNPQTRKGSSLMLKTAGGTTFSKSINVLFTGAPRITSNDSTFFVPPLGTKQIQFTVDDINGNPMVGGTSIKVTGVGLDTTGAVLTGDLVSDVKDSHDKSYTKFNISVADKRTKNLSANIPITINIEVAGDNGNIKKSFTGVLSSIVSGDSGKVGTVSLVNSSTDSIVASGAGSPNSVTVQAKVLTVVGQPSASIPVNFTIVKNVNGGEYLSSQVAFTNAAGIATTTLYSGIRAGLVQVQASVKKDSLAISSDLKNIYIKTGKVSSIFLVSVSAPIISVKGGGGNENSVMVFEGRDSLGNAIDGSNQASITFLLKGDTSGARINPTIIGTDPNTGRVTASLSSGNQSGIIQVVAQSGSVQSRAVQISVSGGLPAQSQFTLNMPKKNYSILTDKTTIPSVTVGDAQGNPVSPNTLVNFKTNGGLISSAAFTNADGSASTTLQIVNPQPPGGVATIEAKTFGANGVIIRDTQTVVFSREAVITEVGGPFNNFEIEDGLSKTFQYTVADVNGNPLSQGNVITVESFGLASGNIVISGDINVSLNDSKIQGIGTTQFSFTARDTVKDEGQGPKPLGFKIKVTGPNTIGTLVSTFNGTLKGGAGVGNEGSVASVSYSKSSKDTIFVANAGIPTTDTITFVARNLNQLPVKGAAVQFFFEQAQNASEFLSPSYAVSDDSGRVKVAVHSGIKAGVLKVMAKVTAGNSVISSLPVNVFIKTGPLKSIALINVDKKEISVRGVGGEENAVITYEARDLLGNPLDFANQTKLFFKMKGVVGFDEEVKPDSALTDPFSGRATVTVTSGTRSTVLQLIAQNADSSIKSSPVPIVVHGGFAVDSLFIFKNVKRNISIYEQNASEFKMQVGDRYGNPVKPGTAVYFETEAGIIGASAFTDAGGNVSTSFSSVLDNSRLGSKVFKASTVGQSGLIQKSINVLMSGRPAITVVNLPTDSLTLFDGTSTTINYRIEDILGNPISSGHGYQIFVDGSVSSQITITGDVSGVLPDTDDKVNGTKFSFVVSDFGVNSGTGGNFKIRIVVTGTTGTTVKTINGTLLAPANIVVPPSARVAASIRLESTSRNDISITGVGGTENATITYQVLDSVGAPVDRQNKATVAYKVNFNPNGFTLGGTPPKILPLIDSTDENGKSRVSITSGTQAGVVQIEATITMTNPVRTIKSQPVTISINSGFADQGHFTLSPNRYNFPGLQRSFLPMSVTVQIGDKYSNPVKQGTVVYFNSANGIIQTQQGLTDNNGFVTMTLFSGNPLPLSPKLASGLTDGYSRVYARTIGRDSANILDSVDILWTGSPIVTKTDAINSYTIANGGTAGPFSFTVLDYLGHPMSEGTSIAVEATGLEVSGNANITMPDTKSTGAGLTSFTFTVKDANLTDTEPPAASLITVIVTHPVYGTYKRVIASGTVD
ncbi:MAG: hypothetical protein ACOYNS_00705 [Bacteroidota bacterium]